MLTKLCTILIFSFPLFLFAQGQEMTDTPTDRYLQSEIEQREFDRETWTDLVEGVDFSEKERKQKRRQNDPNTTRNWSPDSLFGGGVAFARFLLIVIGAVVIAFLLRSILGYGQAKNKRIQQDTEEAISIEKIEENLHEADLDDYIRQAKEAGTFNLAIRLYYLAILKELSLQKAIKWKVDKTNWEYLRELQGSKYLNDFRDLTHIFEQIWYGDRPFDVMSFNQLEPRFRALLDQLMPTPQTADS